MFNAQIQYYPTKTTRLFYLHRWQIFRGQKPAVVSRDLPQKWDELRDYELIALAKSRFLISGEKSQRLFFLFKLLRLPVWIFDQIPMDDANKIYSHLAKLLGDGIMSNWPISRIRCRKNYYLYGPEQRGADICFLEFINADKYYNRYLKTQDIKWLNYLVATLYRPLHGKNDSEFRRVKFSEYMIQNFAKLVENAPDEVKYAVLLNYSGFRKYIENLYPRTFSEPEKGKASRFGLHGVLLNVAGPKFGDDDATGAKPLHAILTYIELTHEQLEDSK